MDQNIANLCNISVVHPDILRTHVLNRLDGPTLAAAGSASCQLRALSFDDSLWRDICNKMWPSTAQVDLRELIGSFPSGHRSFYADSYSTVHGNDVNISPTFRRYEPWSSMILTSAIDIRYKNNECLFSKVLETDTTNGSRTGLVFQVEALSSGKSLPIPGKFDIGELSCESELENNLTMSWILIDSVHKRAASLTSGKPVCVDRDWATGDVEVRFGTVLCGEKKGELVECAIVAVCGGWNKEDLHVKQVRLEIEDVEGNKLGWKESLVILQEAIENGDRIRGGEKVAYAKFLEMKEQNREGKLRKERLQEEVGICTGAVMVVGFWMMTTVMFFQLVCSFF